MSRATCPNCGWEIDPTTCHCGERIRGENDYHDNHSPVPMGCTCFYLNPEKHRKPGHIPGVNIHDYLDKIGAKPPPVEGVVVIPVVDSIEEAVDFIENLDKEP